MNTIEAMEMTAYDLAEQRQRIADLETTLRRIERMRPVIDSKTEWRAYAVRVRSACVRALYTGD